MFISYMFTVFIHMIISHYCSYIQQSMYDIVLITANDECCLDVVFVFYSKFL